MNYRLLGRTGMKVSELCLGTMEFGRGADEATSIHLLERFVEAGGNFIDTADVYNEGISEEIIGGWMKHQRRDALVIATKVRFPTGQSPNDVGLSRKHILSAIENSLRRLQTDYIDLYQVHCWDQLTPLEETLDTLNTLVKSGKARYIGASNYTAWQLQRAVDLSRHNGWEPFCCLQPLYNLLDRDIEIEIIPVCQNEGLGIIPWSPLRGGWLSGRYKRGMTRPPQNSRVEEASKHNWSERWEVYNTERTWNIIDALFAITAETGKSVAQVALNWVKDRPGVTAPIIGVRTIQHLEDNLGATGWSLSSEHRDWLDRVSDIPLPYPQSFIHNARRE
ncbi:MAG: aldo/keto reductase [Anaerolineales bacterium]